MIDENDGGAVGPELSQVLEQLFDLLRNEHRGWLIEDKDLGPSIEHLDDLDPLLLADLERLDEVVGIDIEPVGSAHFTQVLLGAIEIDAATGEGRL